MAIQLCISGVHDKTKGIHNYRLFGLFYCSLKMNSSLIFFYPVLHSAFHIVFHFLYQGMVKKSID